MLNRRDLLKLSSVAASSLLLPTGLRPAFAAGEDITIGAPLPMSGPFAANGKFGSMGTAMIVEEVGKVLDRKLSYLEIDTEGKPATAVRKVQEAMERGVTLFSGGILSSEALAMGKEVA